MANRKFPVTITLTDKADKKEVASENIDAPGTHIFKDLTSGRTYSANLISRTNKLRVIPPNPKDYTIPEQENTLTLEVVVYDSIFGADAGQRPPGISESPVPDSVIVGTLIASASFVLLGDIVPFFRFITPTPTTTVTSPQITQLQTTNRSIDSTNRSPSSSTRQPRRLSPDLESRLRQCLETAIKNRLDLPISIPSNPDDLLPFLVPFLIEEESSDPTDPGLLLVQRIRAAVEDCDPALIADIITAEKAQDSAQTPATTFQPRQTSIASESGADCCACPEASILAQPSECSDANSTGFFAEHQVGIKGVLIIGEDVNVRLAPNLDSPIIAQISYGLVQVEPDTLAATPGWQAIVLPNGAKGYVAIQYVRFPVLNQP